MNFSIKFCHVGHEPRHDRRVARSHVAICRRLLMTIVSIGVVVFIIVIFYVVFIIVFRFDIDT